MIQKSLKFVGPSLKSTTRPILKFWKDCAVFFNFMSYFLGGYYQVLKAGRIRNSTKDTKSWKKQVSLHCSPRKGLLVSVPCSPVQMSCEAPTPTHSGQRPARLLTKKHIIKKNESIFNGLTGSGSTLRNLTKREISEVVFSQSAGLNVP